MKVQRKGWLFRLVVHERYRLLVRTIGWALTAASLLLAFVTFNSVWTAFFVGAAVWLMALLFEKAIISYTSMFISPLPSFSLQPDKWLGALFGFVRQPGNPHDIPFAGMLIADEEYARQIHSLLVAWAGGRLRDEERNLCVSVIVSGQEYIMFCYPSLSRRPAVEFARSIERERRQVSLDDIHDQLFIMLVLGRKFALQEGSYFPTFRRRYTAGVQCLFKVMVPGPNGSPRDVPGLDPLVLYTLKVKDRQELDRTDMEYDLLRIGPD